MGFFKPSMLNIVSKTGLFPCLNNLDKETCKSFFFVLGRAGTASWKMELSIIELSIIEPSIIEQGVLSLIHSQYAGSVGFIWMR